MRSPALSEIKARKKLVESALKLFSQKGYHAVSVREIAKASGQNIAMVSYYFGGKEGLYQAILQEYISAATTEIKKVFLAKPTVEMTSASFRDGIRSVIAVMVEMKLKNPEVVVLLQREKLNGLPFAKEMHKQYISPLTEQVVERFKLAEKKKIIRPGMNHLVFMGLLIEAIYGFLIAVQTGNSPFKGDYKFPRDKEKFTEFITDLFLEGIMK